MDFLSAPATSLESSSNAFNASDSVPDLLSGSINHLDASTIITVNSIADVVDNSDGVTTLREAINFANADTGEDVIVFARSLFATQQTISLSLGELDITHNLSIIAPRDSLTGGDLLTVSGNNATRVFEIGSGVTVTLSGLIVADGLVTNDDGGGIKNSGTLTLDNSIVRNNNSPFIRGNNNSTSRGGGIYNYGTLNVSNSTISSNSASRDNGGGIYSRGTMNVSNSTISGNSTLFDGGGIYSSGTMNVSNSTISGNSANQAGGGISSFGTVQVSNSTISGNSAANNSGGIYASGTVQVSNSTISGNSAKYDGGGISGSTLTVSNSTISGNSALLGSGGGISSLALTVSNSTISSNSAKTGGGISGSGTVQVSNSTISGNSAQTGGGIYNNGFTFYGDGGNGNDYGGIWTVSNSTISGNLANDRGGGIFNGGTMNVSNSTISSNSATYSISGGDPVGGGIYNYGILKVSNSTLSGNSAANNGGGIYNAPSYNYSKPKNTVEVSNSTISGNSAGNNGGGIYNYGYNISIGDSNNATVTINNSTLTLNSAADGGGMFNLAPGSARVRNTIIASNLFSEDGLNPDVAGRFISDGYNLIGDRTGSIGFEATGDIVGTSDNPIDPRLGPLDSNGGPTQTHALLEDSPAIDAGDPTVLDTDPITDQRGFPRVSGARVDIGAFELS